MTTGALMLVELDDSRLLTAVAAVPAAASDARRQVAEALRVWRLSALTDVVTLLVGELLANAIQADARLRARIPGWVGLRVHRTPRGLAVEVWDRAGGVPVARMAADDDEAGRGLMIVAAVAHRWGHFAPPRLGGTIVWAELELPVTVVADDGPAPLPRRTPKEPLLGEEPPPDADPEVLHRVVDGLRSLDWDPVRIAAAWSGGHSPTPRN